MPAKGSRYLYWDSSVFLAYINGEPGRAEIIDTVWGEIAENKDDRIVTAAISIAEVGFATYEKNSKILDPEAQVKIDTMWRDPSVMVVEMPPRIMFLARDLIRDATTKGWALRPFDAVHLATAMWIDTNVQVINQFHTYDDRLRKYAALIGVPISEPG